MNEKQAQELMEQGWDPRFSNGVLGITDAINPEAAKDDGDPWRSGPGGDPLAGQYEKGNPLRNFITNLSEEDVAEAAKGATDPAFRQRAEASLRDYREGEAASAFVEAHPEYLATDKNYNSIVDYLAEEKLPLTFDNLEAAYAALSAAGELDVPQGQVKPLSDRELLRVARLAQQQRIADAIGEYLHLSVPGFNAKQLADVTADPDYRVLCDEAVYFVFVNSTADFQDSDETRDYLSAFANGRPLSYHLLQEGWKAMRRDALIRAESANAQTAPDLDALSSEEFDRLYRATMREGAKARR